MNTKQLLFTSFFDISHETNSVLSSTNTPNLNDYIISTTKHVIEQTPECRRYKIKREGEVYLHIKECLSLIDTNITIPEISPTTSVDDETFGQIACSIEGEIKTLLFDDITSHHNEIASVLLDVESSSNQGAINITSSGLVQAITLTEIGYQYILIKNEFSPVLQRTTMQKTEGLSIPKKKSNLKLPLKFCVFEISKYINENGDITYEPYNIYIADAVQSNHGPTWYDKFLCLEKCTNDETNTSNAVDVLCKFWEQNVVNKQLGLELRNNTIGYFNTHTQFMMTDYLNVILSHPSVTPDKKTEWSTKISNLSHARKGFDPSFAIIPSSISKRVITQKFSPLSKGTISLSISGEILKNDVCVTKKGNKCYIQILTDDPTTIDSLPHDDTFTQR